MVVKLNNYRLLIQMKFYNCQNKSDIYLHIFFRWYNYYHVLTLI